MGVLPVEHVYKGIVLFSKQTHRAELNCPFIRIPVDIVNFVSATEVTSIWVEMHTASYFLVFIKHGFSSCDSASATI